MDGGERLMDWWVEQKGVKPKHAKKSIGIAEIKKMVSMRKLLYHYGWDWDAPAYVDGWVAIRCPFHGDTNKSASLNDDLGRFRCHACDIGGDVVDVVSAVEEKTPREAIQFLLNVR